MKFRKDITIKIENHNYVITRNRLRHLIPSKYKIIMDLIEMGMDDECKIVDSLVESGMEETEAYLVCADFIMEYANELE